MASSPSPSPHLRLFIPPSLWGLPTPCPISLAALTLLKFLSSSTSSTSSSHRPSYSITICRKWQAPNQTLPLLVVSYPPSAVEESVTAASMTSSTNVLTEGSNVMVTGDDIITTLLSLYPSLDSRLSTDQRRYQRLFSRSFFIIYQALLLEWWTVTENYHSVIVPTLSSDAPWPYDWFQTWTTEKAVVSYLCKYRCHRATATTHSGSKPQSTSQSTSQSTDPSFSSDYTDTTSDNNREASTLHRTNRQLMFHNAAEWFQWLASHLSSSIYFFGDYPCTMDALLLGVLLPASAAPSPRPYLCRELLRYPNLIVYIDRLALSIYGIRRLTHYTFPLSLSSPVSHALTRIGDEGGGDGRGGATTEAISPSPTDAGERSSGSLWWRWWRVSTHLGQYFPSFSLNSPTDADDDSKDGGFFYDFDSKYKSPSPKDAKDKNAATLSPERQHQRHNALFLLSTIVAGATFFAWALKRNDVSSSTSPSTKTSSPLFLGGDAAFGASPFK